MSDQTHHSTARGNTALGFILGAVLVVLIGVGYAVYTDEFPLGDKPDVSIELPGGGEIQGEVKSGSD